MVLEILADPGKVMQGFDAQRSQTLALADARELEQLRRIDRPSAKDDLAPGADGSPSPALVEFDGNRPLALEQDLAGERAGFDPEVRAGHCRVEIGDCGRAALAVADVDLKPADPFLLGSVEIAARKAERFAGGNCGFGNLVTIGGIGDVERAADRMVVAFAVGLMLGAAEIREDIVPRPALGTQLPPMVVVTALSANVEHGVDRRGAAEHFTARPDMLAVAGAGIGIGQIEPVDLWVLERLRIADRDVNPQVREEL